MSTPTTQADVVTAAMSIAKDAAEGRLAPSDVEHQAVAELRELVGTVVGEGDPIWPLQLQIARGVLAVGGIEPDELSEWLAVGRQRAGAPLSQPEPDHVPPELVSLLSVAHSPEAAAPEAEPEPTPDLEPVADAEPDASAPTVPQHRTGGYDPLRGWGAAGRGFVG